MGNIICFSIFFLNYWHIRISRFTVLEANYPETFCVHQRGLRPWPFAYLMLTVHWKCVQWYHIICWPIIVSSSILIGIQHSDKRFFLFVCVIQLSWTANISFDQVSKCDRSCFVISFSKLLLYSIYNQK